MSSAQIGGVLADAPSAEMERIIEANRDAGHHFFEASTMRFFNSTVYPRVFGGRYFITGERYEGELPGGVHDSGALDNGHLSTVGDFQVFASYEDAEDAVIEGLCGGEFAGEGD